MRRLLAGLAVALLLVVYATPAKAIPGFSLGVDAAVNFPTGDWADVSGTAIGALAYASFDIIPMLKFTARAGYLHGLEKDAFSLSHIPALAGIKWFPMAMGLYLSGELGMIWTKAKLDLGALGNSESDWESEFGGTVGVGFGAGPLDARLSLFMPDFGELEHLKGILITAGYRF